MPSTLSKRPCAFCQTWFRPSARLVGKQYACAAPDCQKLRKAESQRGWVAAHPGAFRGRAEKHRAYRRARAERAEGRKSARREKDDRSRSARRRCAELRRSVEQDSIALHLVKPTGVGGQVLPATEQDSIRAQAFVLLGLAAQVSLAGEQDSIRPSLSELHDLGRRLLGGKHGTRPR
jgi:hypothetical protein